MLVAKTCPNISYNWSWTLKNSLNIDRLLFFLANYRHKHDNFRFWRAPPFLFCFAEYFLLRMVWFYAMSFDRIQWNGAAGASIFKEASSQGYITNKVELVSLACEDAIHAN